MGFVPQKVTLLETLGNQTVPGEGRVGGASNSSSSGCLFSPVSDVLAPGL